MDLAINGVLILAGEGGGIPMQNHNRKLNSEREESHFLDCSEGVGQDDRGTCDICCRFPGNLLPVFLF